MRFDDGVLTLHQSDVGNFLTCPEQFRRVNHLGSGRMPEPDDVPVRVETDAATIGTTLHAVIEAELRGDVFGSEVKLQEFGRAYMGSLVSDYVHTDTPYRCETYGDDPRRALGALDRLVSDWYRSTEREYWLQREPDSFLIEHFFDVPFVLRSDDSLVREVRLAGTADIVDFSLNRVLDWKSGGRAYQRWEKQRWAVQPTVYTFAAVHEGLIQPDVDGRVRFDYRIYLRDGKGGEHTPQEVTVYRGQGQWAWLTELVNNIADMCESNAASWPLSDDHALCGPKWCPVWDNCKGRFVNDDWI